MFHSINKGVDLVLCVSGAHLKVIRGVFFPVWLVVYKRMKKKALLHQLPFSDASLIFLVLSKEVCESDIVMCPRCDKRCKVWKLSDTCDYAKVIRFLFFISFFLIQLATFTE